MKAAIKRFVPQLLCAAGVSIFAVSFAFISFPGIAAAQSDTPPTCAQGKCFSSRGVCANDTCSSHPGCQCPLSGACVCQQ